VHTNRSGFDPNDTAALEAGEFAGRLRPLASPGPLAVAVSGGADSLALCLLTADWARVEGRPLTALTVDHGLRPESASEAAQVGAWLAARDIPHVILKWAGAKPERGIQAAARDARYALLTGWCRRSGVRDLLLAHHRDDQAETVLLRATRGSGPDGRAGMAAAVLRDGVRLLRPLLRVPRDRLRATLRARGQEWIEDSSNDNPAYARVRARQALALTPALTNRLALQADAEAALRAEREALAEEILLSHAEFAEAGYCWLSRAAPAAPDAAFARTLAHVLRHVSGRAYFPSQRTLDPMVRWLRGDAAGARTLHGCVVAAHPDRFLVCREARSLPTTPITAGESVPWDNRFRVTLGRGRPGGLGYAVAALGPQGWAAVRGRAARCMPYRAVQAVPALYADGEVLAVPHLGIEAPGVAFSVSPLSAESLALRPFAVV